MPDTKESGVTPERMDDPFRPIRYRIYRDHAYEPSNVEARFLLERIKALEIERDKLRDAMAHVVNDSPGTPESVKGYLRTALERR